jgi:hypothetical protein
MQKMIWHKTKTRSSWASQFATANPSCGGLIACNRLPEAQGGPILSRRLALRSEFCECLKPLFYQ